MNNELKHYGVLGMKWGKRKAKRIPSEDSARVKQIRKKKVYEMSNKELTDANNRLQLERNYKQLSQKTKHGKKAVHAFIKTAGTMTAAVAAYSTYKKLGGKALDQIGNMIVKSIDLSGKLTD